MTAAIDLAEKLALFNEHWSPRIIGELNDQHVKLAKVVGEFQWHHHANEDELFMVISGCLVLRFAENEVELKPGQLCIVPRGVEHQPYAEEETAILMFEPAATVNTGEERNESTVVPVWI